jgi:hypothetical protein
MRITGNRLIDAMARLDLSNLPERFRPSPSPQSPLEKDPDYLESLPPHYVVHTVHGTFAKRADWVEKDSSLCRTLRRQLGWRARIEPFRWSGANSIKHRKHAADGFRRHLVAKLDEFPNAHHVVIAHSHGGNVAFWAINNENLAKRVLGIVTLATPFLSAHARRNENELIDWGTAFFAGLFTCWGVLFYLIYKGRDFAQWPWAVGIGLGLLLAMALGAWLLERMQQHAERLASCMPASALLPEQVAIVRVQGDEATAAITGVRLAGSMADLIWGIISAPLYKRINQMLKVMDYGGMRSLHEQLKSSLHKTVEQAHSLRDDVPAQIPTRGNATLSTLSLSGHYSQIYTPPQKKDERWTSQAWQTLLSVGPPLLIDYVRTGTQTTRLVVFVCLMLISLPAIFAVATIVLGLPFGLISALSLVLIDWSAPLAGPYLRVMAEPSPAGTWRITQFEADRAPQGLFHSQSYQNPMAQNFIADWVLERSREEALSR